MSKDVASNTKEKALERKQIKNLKVKDVNKKLMGIEYCLKNPSFVQHQVEVLPLLISCLTRIKNPDLIKAALDFIISFLTEPKDEDVICGSNAQLLLTRCAVSEENWKAGDLILSLLVTKIPVDLQVLALKLLNLLLEKTFSLLMFASPTSTPLPSLTQVIDTTTSEPLRKAAVECFYAHLSTISDDKIFEASITNAQPAFPCLTNIMTRTDIAEHTSLVVTTLGIFELCSRSKLGRQQLVGSEVSKLLITLLNRMETLTENEHMYTEQFTFPISKIFSRLCIDQEIEEGTAEHLIEILLKFLARALSKLPLLPYPTDANATSKGQGDTISSAVEIICCLGRLVEREPSSLAIFKRQKPFPLLLQCFGTREPVLCHVAEKMIHLCCKNGPDVDLIFTEEEVMDNRSNLAEKTLEFLEKQIESDAVDGLVTRWDIAFRLLRWLSVVVGCQANAQALGARACQAFLSLFQHIVAYLISGDQTGPLPLEQPQLVLFIAYLMRCIRAIHSVCEPAFSASSSSSSPFISSLLDMITSQANQALFTGLSAWTASSLDWDIETQHIESVDEDRDKNDVVIPLVECVRALSGWMEAFLLWNKIDIECKDLKPIPLPNVRQRLLDTEIPLASHTSPSNDIKAEAALLALISHGIKIIALIGVLVEKVEIRCYSFAIIELIHLIKSIYLIPGAIKFMLIHAGDAKADVSPSMSDKKTFFRPQTLEETIEMPHFKVLEPFLRLLEHEKSNWSEIQPVVEILSVLCGSHGTEQVVDSFDRDQFSQFCLNCDGILKLLSVIRISDTANTKARESFEASVSTLCLRLIAFVQQQLSLASSNISNGTSDIQFNEKAWLELLDRKGDVSRFGYQSYPPILMAIDTTNFEILAKLVEAGVDVNGTNLDGLTSLMLSLLTGDVQAVDTLLMADVDAKMDESELTVWMCALVGSPKKDSSLLSRCLTRGMNVNILTRDGQSLLHSILSSADVTQSIQGILTRFDYDSRSERIGLNMIKGIVEVHRANLNACNVFGQTPLHLALLYGHADVVEYFLSLTSSLDTMESMLPGPIRSLRVQGVNPNIQDGFGTSSLHYASFGLWANNLASVPTILNGLLKQAEFHPIVPGRHFDPLQNATRDERKRIEIDALLDAGYLSLLCPVELTVKSADLKDVVTNRTHFGLLPFQLACYGGGAWTIDFGSMVDARMRQQIQANGAIRAAIITSYRHIFQGLGLKCDTIDLNAAMDLAITSQVGESNADVIACLEQWT